MLRYTDLIDEIDWLRFMDWDLRLSCIISKFNYLAPLSPVPYFHYSDFTWWSDEKSSSKLNKWKGQLWEYWTMSKY